MSIASSKYLVTDWMSRGGLQVRVLVTGCSTPYESNCGGHSQPKLPEMNQGWR